MVAPGPQYLSMEVQEEWQGFVGGAALPAYKEVNLLCLTFFAVLQPF